MRDWRAVAVVAVIAASLTGCGSAVSQDEVHEAIVRELVDDSTVVRVLEGDEAAARFVEGMHDLAEDMAESVMKGACDQPAYEAGLHDRTLIEAHRAGCAVLEAGGEVDA